MSYSLEIGFYPIIYMLQQNFRSSQYLKVSKSLSIFIFFPTNNNFFYFIFFEKIPSYLRNGMDVDHVV